MCFLKIFDAMKKFSFFICSVGVVLILLGLCPLVFSSETVQFDSEIKDGLTMPLDIAFNSSGQLLVFDANKSIVAFDAEGKKQLSFSINNGGAGAEKVVNFGAMAFTPSGRLVVADPVNSRVQVFNLVGELLFSFGSSGNVPGKFKGLSSIDVDVLGFIYVADSANKRVQIFTPNGVFMRAIVLPAMVADISIDYQGNIYALLPEIGKIEKFSNDGKKIKEITCKVNTRDEVQKSSRLQVDPWGNIYLAQAKDERIVKIDQSGNILISFGSEGKGRGQFSGIVGLMTDESGRVYVADSGNVRVQIFKVLSPLKSVLPKMTAVPLLLDFESTIDAVEGINDIFSLPGKGLFSVADKKSRVDVWSSVNQTIGSEGAGAGQFSKPTGVYVTLDNRMYISDTGNHRVQIFNSDRTLSYEFGRNGNKPGQFNFPQGIVVNSKGMIYVADTLNHRIQVFNQDGIYLKTFGQPDTEVVDEGLKNCQTLNLPKVLALDSKDRLYVVDVDLTRIKVFDESGSCLASIGGQETVGDSFVKIVDIAFDQNDNLYVADFGAAQIKIFNAKGKFLLSFGSSGIGQGYFTQLSAVAANEGRIYVADYQNNQVQVFRYSPDGLLGKSERLNITKTAAPPEIENNAVFRYAMARKAAYEEALREFSDGLGFSKEYLLLFVRIDSVESLNDGQVKVTISIPKFIPREIIPIDSGAFKSGGLL